MNHPAKCNRRNFIKTTAATTASAFVLPRFSIGQPGPSANSKLNIAHIGASNIARMAFHETRKENIYAIADVDSSKFNEYSEKFPKIESAEKFADFRKMLDKLGNNIDGVCVSTPDHTHFAATMEAMQRGLHVCTQKPLAHNIWQVRALRKAKAKYNVITNMANQGHTFDGIRQMREWVEADVFGQITEVHSWTAGPGWGGRYFAKPESFPPPEDPVPESLNWDLWQGPVADTTFHSTYHPEQWRGFNKYGGGTFGDWFCHIADAPVWVLDLYEPVSVEAIKVVGGNEWIVPDGNSVRYEFKQRGSKKPCTFYWHNGPGGAKNKKQKKGQEQMPEAIAGHSFHPKPPKDWTWPDIPNKGTYYLGEKANGHTDERSNKPRLADKEKMKEFKAAGFPDEKYPRIKGGPFGEWVKAIKNGTEPGANFDYAAQLTEVSLIGQLAARFGGKIEWDAKNMKITNRPELNAYLKEPARKGWEYGEDL
ncbi:MAG: Gfo/Idh/MocA family oxidoreductase [Verrucomicrobiota bacterium]